MRDEQKYKPLEWDLSGDKTEMVHALKEQMDELIEFIEGPCLKYYSALNNEEFYNLVEFRVGKVLQNMRVGLGIEAVDMHIKNRRNREPETCLIRPRSNVCDIRDQG